MSGKAMPNETIPGRRKRVRGQPNGHVYERVYGHEHRHAIQMCAGVAHRDVVEHEPQT